MTAAEPQFQRRHFLPRDRLLQLSFNLRDALSAAPYAPPEGSSFSVKSHLQSLLPSPICGPNDANRTLADSTDVFLLCAAVAAAHEESPSLHWVTKPLSLAARSALTELAAEMGFGGEEEMVVEMAAEVLPRLKAVIKETCVNTEDDADVVAASVKAPVGLAIVAAHQFRWMVSKVVLELPFILSKIVTSYHGRGRS